jgi:hypothetical protein
MEAALAQDKARDYASANWPDVADVLNELFEARHELEAEG